MTAYRTGEERLLLVHPLTRGLGFARRSAVEESGGREGKGEKAAQRRRCVKEAEEKEV